MTEDTAKYNINPDQLETDNLKFCPLAGGMTTGPLGKLQFHRPPCDPAHCALGTAPCNTCSLLDLPLAGLQLTAIRQLLDKALNLACLATDHPRNRI